MCTTEIMETKWVTTEIAVDFTDIPVVPVILDPELDSAVGAPACLLVKSPPGKLVGLTPTSPPPL